MCTLIKAISSFDSKRSSFSRKPTARLPIDVWCPTLNSSRGGHFKVNTFEQVHVWSHGTPLPSRGLTEWHTDKTENITFSHSFVGGKNHIKLLPFFYFRKSTDKNAERYWLDAVLNCPPIHDTISILSKQIRSSFLQPALHSVFIFFFFNEGLIDAPE